MRTPLPLARRGLAALAAACALLAAPAHARPPTIDDVLQAGTIADTDIDPTERWAVIEHARPYASAPRFDFDLLQGLITTELRLLDLDRPGPAGLLFAPEPGAGYAAGPFSPDGRRLAVFRLTDDSWTLGIAEPAARTVRWFPVTPELSWEGRSLAWISPTELLVLTPPPGELPLYIRIQRNWRALPPRWETAALGGVSASVWGSGAALGARPRRAPGLLLKLDVLSGRVTALAEGRFIDLEAAPGGRHAALLEAGHDVRLKPDETVHGDMGVATFRKRLRLLSVADGRLSSPCPRCDLLQGVLAWSPAGDRLLAYAREDGAPWRDGRLLDIHAATGRVATPGAGRIRPDLVRRPEIVSAAWLGGDPIVFGRPADAPATARGDWWRLGPSEAVNLTADLPAVPRHSVLPRADRLLVAGPLGAWSVERHGRARRLDATPLEGLPVWTRALTSRAVHSLTGRAGLPVRRAGPGGDMLVDVGRDPAAGLPLPAGAELYAHAPRRRAALVRTLHGGGRQVLQWIAPGAPPVTVLTANAHLAEVDVPRALPVRHAGPDGRPLTSWLLLPGRADGAPPPLVVFPYIGWTYPRPPQLRVSGTFRDRFEVLPLVGHGYAVLLPSLPYPTDGRAPAEGLADRILAVVEAAARHPDTAGTFDPDRLGLVGLSFGGYAALSVLTQTDRFAAAVATHGPSSLISKWGEFGPPGRTFPETEVPSAWSIGWTETLQGRMGAPPWAAADRYVRNSPVMQADRITTPLMLVQGEFDSMAPEEAERMFSALFRQDKDALLVVYHGEGHVFGSPATNRDYFARMFAWLDARLRPKASSRGGHGLVVGVRGGVARAG